MYIFIEWSIFRILAFLANTQRAVNKREAFPVSRSRDYLTETSNTLLHKHCATFNVTEMIKKY